LCLAPNTSAKILSAHRAFIGICPTKNPNLTGTPHFRSFEELIAAKPNVDVVVICTPSVFYHKIAKAALKARCHVILEKPPTEKPSHIEDLKQRAAILQLVFITLWHSQHAAGVGAAMQRLQSSRIKSIKIDWEEDFYRYHPGQYWVTRTVAGGIFDPLVNALSIVEKVLGTTVKLVRGEAQVPSNWKRQSWANTSSSLSDAVTFPSRPTLPGAREEDLAGTSSSQQSRALR
jgi:D-galactose 1-dehydrogenase